MDGDKYYQRIYMFFCKLKVQTSTYINAVSKNVFVVIYYIENL